MNIFYINEQTPNNEDPTVSHTDNLYAVVLAAKKS